MLQAGLQAIEFGPTGHNMILWHSACNQCDIGLGKPDTSTVHNEKYLVTSEIESVSAGYMSAADSIDKVSAE